MKVRNGFVSNSSSSSFCIYGAEMSISELPEEFYNKYMDKIKKDWFGESEEDMPETLEDLIAYVEDNCMENDLLEFLGLQSYGGDYSTYIGREWSSIGDNETGRQFKNSVEAIIKEINPKASFGTHEEVVYN